MMFGRKQRNIWVRTNPDTGSTNWVCDMDEVACVNVPIESEQGFTVTLKNGNTFLFDEDGDKRKQTMDFIAKQMRGE